MQGRFTLPIGLISIVAAIAYLFPEVFHLIARTDAGMQQVADRRGKRVALMPTGSGSYRLFWVLSQRYSIREAAFQPLPMALLRNFHSDGSTPSPPQGES